MIITFLLSIASATVVSIIVTPLVRNLFIRRGWVENPLEKQKKTSNATALTSVPRGGGISVFFSVLFTALLFLPLDKHLAGILIASALVLLIGVWDDLRDISPKLRLVTNVIAAGIVVSAGIGIAYISNPFGGVIDLSQPQIVFNFIGTHTIWILSDILAIMWITWCMNITGWAAGVEGQLPGFVAISAIFIGLLGLRFSSDLLEWPVIILAGAVAGAYLGFIPYNFYPQSIMPGYSGKSLAGFYLAVLSILSGAKLATLMLLLGIPMIDAVFVMIRRVSRGKSIFISDDSHLHHQLLKNGWSRPKIAVFYWSLSLLLGIISLFLNSQQKLYVLIGLIILFSGFALKVYRRI